MPDYDKKMKTAPKYPETGKGKRRLANPAAEAVGRIAHILPKMPKFAQIEITNDCNLNCKMCPRNFLKVPFKHMSMDIYRKVVDNLDTINTLTLTGWGEPFYYDNIFECIEYAKKKGIKVKLTTNGVLLNEEKIQKIIKSGLDEITFSIDHIKGDPEFGHPNTAALNSIDCIVGLREETCSDTPKIVLQPTMHAKKGRNVLDVIKWGAEHGCDRINIARLDLRFDPALKRASAEDEKRLFKAADRLGRKLGIRVDILYYAVFDGMKRTAYKYLRHVMHRFDTRCSKGYNYIYINVDGYVTPCCLYPTMNMGDLKKDSLSSIWKGKRFSKFRKDKPAQCEKCDVARIRHIC